jgi:hypothetical protein
VDAAHMTAFRAVLEKRLEDLSAAQIKRIQRLVK